MNFKLLKIHRGIWLILTGILLSLLSGCFSAITASNLTSTKADWFSPTALYKSKTDGDLAVEGMLAKAGESNPAIRYLIVPQKLLVAAHLQSGGDVSFKGISSLPPQSRESLKLQKHLSKDYEKVADMRNQDGVNVNQRKTVNIKAAGLLPFAFVIDAVAFPLEIPMMKAMKEMQNVN